MIERYVLFFILGVIVGVLVFLLMKRRQLKENRELSANLNQAKAQLNHSDTSISKLNDEMNKLRLENKDQNSLIASLQTTNEHLQESISAQKSNLEESNKRLKVEFENLSNKLLEQSSKRINEQSKNDLNQILNPFKEKIKHFETKVEDKATQDVRDRARLMTEIKNLTELNETMRAEAKNLTTALKGDTKQQGNWGELVLERVMEQSGLVKGEEYQTQYSTDNVEGKRQRPDVVVNLPDNKHLIIDSKVSLKSYEASMSSDDPTEIQMHIKKHLMSVKNHIRELNEKNYQRANGIDSPDFVLMFMPIEASFSLAVKEDISLYSFAWDRKVVIVSPSTLLATLRTISSLWKQEKQNRNALEIANQAGLLYDKFVGFTEDLIKVGKQLASTNNAYQDSMNKLTEGRGNLVRKAQQIKALGAKSSKKLNEKLSLRADASKIELEKQED